MRQASERFDDGQRREVAQAVHAAEAATSAELLPVVATRSGRYDRAEDTAGVLLGILLLAAVHLWFRGMDPEGGSWGASATRFELPALLAAFLAGLVGGASLAARCETVARLFAPRAQMEEEVSARARAVFFDQRVHHTGGRSGLLLYLSLLERTACVLGDDEVLDRLGPPALDAICATLVRGMRAGDPTAALVNAIREAAEPLARLLPRAGGDANELADALVTIDD